MDIQQYQFLYLKYGVDQWFPTQVGNLIFKGALPPTDEIRVQIYEFNFYFILFLMDAMLFGSLFEPR